MWNTALAGTDYIVRDASDGTDDTFPNHKPDICLNHRERGEAAWRAELDKLSFTADGEERAEHVAQITLAWNTSTVGVKLKPDDDPFGPGTDIDWDSGSHRSRDQILKHVGEMFLRQHMECVYVAFIAGSRARLMRWDHCGVVVTEAFDYIKDPTDLVNFFYFLATSTPEVQGHDTSMAVATEKQKAGLANYKRELEDRGDRPYHLRFVDEMMENSNMYPYYQVSIIHRPPTEVYLPVSAAEMSSYIRWRSWLFCTSGRRPDVDPCHREVPCRG